jgi:hypothetical protein
MAVQCQPAAWSCDHGMRQTICFVATLVGCRAIALHPPASNPWIGIFRIVAGKIPTSDVPVDISTSEILEIFSRRPWLDGIFCYREGIAEIVE